MNGKAKKFLLMCYGLASWQLDAGDHWEENSFTKGSCIYRLIHYNALGVSTDVKNKTFCRFYQKQWSYESNKNILKRKIYRNKSMVSWIISWKLRNSKSIDKLFKTFLNLIIVLSFYLFSAVQVILILLILY